MPNFLNTPSAATQPWRIGNTLLTPAEFNKYIITDFDELVDELDSTPVSSLQHLFRSVPQSADQMTEMSKLYGTNVAPLLEDGSPMAWVDYVEGWTQTHYVHTYAIGHRYTRRAMEQNNYGFIDQGRTEVQRAAARTMKAAYADVFNRAIAATNAQVLCRDGMLFIDAARPNPVRGVAAWSNEETTTDFDEDALFQAQLNAMNLRGPNGERMARSIMKIHLPNAYQQIAYKTIKATLERENSTNAPNWAQSLFSMDNVEYHEEFTGNTVFYQLVDDNSDENGLQHRSSQSWSTETWAFESPDVMGARIRAVWGIGITDPRMWRGGLLNAL